MNQPPPRGPSTRHSPYNRHLRSPPGHRSGLARSPTSSNIWTAPSHNRTQSGHVRSPPRHIRSPPIVSCSSTSQHSSRNQAKWPMHSSCVTNRHYQLFNSNNDKDANCADIWGKQMSSTPGQSQNLFVPESMNEIRRNSPPPYLTQAQENSMRTPNQGSHSSTRIDAIHHSTTFDYCLRNPSELRLSPIHIQNPSFYTPDDRPKSASPSRKFRRLPHLETTPSSRWDPRRPSQPSHSHNTRRSNARKIRYTGYNTHMWEHNDPFMHSPPSQQCHFHPQPPVTPRQSAYVTQVPMTVPVSLCTSTMVPHHHHQMPSHQMHNLYSAPSIHTTPMTHRTHPHPAPTFMLPQTPNTLHYSPPRQDAILRGSSPPSIFISEPRNQSMEMTVRSRLRPNSGGRWRLHQLNAEPIIPHHSVIRILAMLGGPLSPESATSEGEMENYEALLHVAERLSEDRPKGLNKSEINSIPSFKFHSAKHRGDQTSCVVCMCDFEEEQRLRDLPCSHKFHAKCVDKWLKSNRTCPICRGDAFCDPSLSE